MPNGTALDPIDSDTERWLNLRLHELEDAALTKAARAEGRSKSSELRKRLVESLRRDGYLPPAPAAELVTGAAP